MVVVEDAKMESMVETTSYSRCKQTRASAQELVLDYNIAQTEERGFSFFDWFPYRT